MAPVTGISSTPRTSAKTVGVASRGTGDGLGDGDGVGDGLGGGLGDALGDGDGLGDGLGDGDGLGAGIRVAVGTGVGLGDGTTVTPGDETGVVLVAIPPKPKPGKIRKRTWAHMTTTAEATSTASTFSTWYFFIYDTLRNRPHLGRV